MLLVVLDDGTVDGPEVGIVLIFGEGEFDVEDEFIELHVKFYTKEGH